MVKIECFFDCSSPWAYLGFSNLVTLSTRLGIDVEWRPVIAGFIFAEVNPDIYATRRLMTPPLRGANESKEMQSWADHAGLELNVPPACGHPVKTVKCMRACIVMEPRGKLVAFATAAFEALWRDGRNLGHDEVLRDVCLQIGVDPDEVLSAIEEDGPKRVLKANNAALAQRGGFGVPTFYVDEEQMFFGNNRLELVEHQLRKRLRLAPATI